MVLLTFFHDFTASFKVHSVFLTTDPVVAKTNESVVVMLLKMYQFHFRCIVYGATCALFVKITFPVLNLVDLQIIAVIKDILACFSSITRLHEMVRCFSLFRWLW